MISSLALATSLLVQVPDRQCDYAVWMNGGRAGTAQITVKDLPDQRRQVLLTMTLKMGGPEAKVRQETIYEKDGAASRKILESTLDGGKRSHILAELSDAGAKLTITEGGKTSTSNVPLSAKAPRSNPSTFWFDRTQPKVGEKISYYAFEIADRQWKLMTSTYMGLRDVEPASKPIKAHKVMLMRSGIEVANWLDAKGMPVALIQGDSMRIERNPLPASVR